MNMSRGPKNKYDTHGMMRKAAWLLYAFCPGWTGSRWIIKAQKSRLKQQLHTPQQIIVELGSIVVYGESLRNEMSWQERERDNDGDRHKGERLVEEKAENKLELKANPESARENQK